MVCMGVYLPRTPPPLTEASSWRELWRAGAFAQLDFIWDTNFSALAKERGLDLGIGQRRLEGLDVQGAFQPIAFVEDRNPRGAADFTPIETRMTFREEEPARGWSTYAG